MLFTHVCMVNKHLKQLYFVYTCMYDFLQHSGCCYLGNRALKSEFSAELISSYTKLNATYQLIIINITNSLPSVSQMFAPKRWWYGKLTPKWRALLW